VAALAVVDPIDADHIVPPGMVGMRVEISDLGACLTDCVPLLPATGLGVTVAIVAVVGAALVVGGILFAARRRRAAD